MAKANQKTPLSPKLPTLMSGEFFLENEAIFSGLKGKDGDQSYLSAKNMVLRETELNHLIMQSAQLERFECSNVIFDHCDFSNLAWIGASFHQVIFRQCKLIGTNFAESYLRDCTFDDCLINFASFSHTDLKAVTFSDCALNEAEFNEVYWKNLNMQNNQLTHSSWLLTNMAGLDLSNNFFDSIALSQEFIKGLQVNQEQAITIAQGLGLIIE
ncbi:MAG: pentapeptide repeat-containing protein [Tetragenococcus sp.]|nr:pentapeptide repeat-containing protein [Tetragenococcus sp.]